LPLLGKEEWGQIDHRCLEHGVPSQEIPHQVAVASADLSNAADFIHGDDSVKEVIEEVSERLVLQENVPARAFGIFEH
jgi:hypothetical protein